MSIFKRFHPRLQEAIVSRLGWKSLREVQELSSQAILDNKNAIILAPTAGGKTEAAFFPVISKMLDESLEGTQCIYISPIRALLNNQEERLGIYSEMVGLNRFKWHGESKKKDKNNFIKEPAEILMITPESLEVMLISSSVPNSKIFKNLKFVVIDEIHALANCDRGSHLMSILERLRNYSDFDFQRIGLSATVGNFEEILDWLQGSSKNEKIVINPPKPKSSKKIEVKYLDEIAMTQEVAVRGYGKKSLFFTDSRARAEKVGQALKNKNIDIFVHHSSISREEREIAEEKVTHGKNVSIICTSTLELGIDVGELDLIFQAESTSTVASFLQRMGRTGRRPNTISNMTFFTTEQETMLQAIAIVELAKEHWVEDVKMDFKAWHILVHQLMALCLQFGAISRNKVWKHIQYSSPFKQISEIDFNILVSHLISTDYISEESGLLSMGIQAEKIFGRKNFMELYSVFTSPVDYKVNTLGGQVLGSVEWEFADMLEEDYCFILSGKGWIVKRIEHSQREVWVDKAPKGKAPKGKAPKWGGFGPHILSYNLCRKIKQVLTDNQNYIYCDPKTIEKLNELRADKQFLNNGFAPIQITMPNILWWTYAGARINNTLKYSFQKLLNCEVVSNNYFLKFKFEETNTSKIEDIILRMKEKEFWNNEFISSISKMLPKHRLSKFQNCLPEKLQSDLIANEFLDITKTIEFIRNI